MNQHYNIEWLTDKFDNEEPIKFLFFWGHTNKHGQKVGNFCFSQWFESPFKVNGITYKTSEHWMMAQKALLFNNKDIFDQIVNCDKPGEAKELGRKVIGFDEIIWNENRFEIVKLGNIHKFNQNKSFGEYLLQSGNRVIVESSPVDTIWGIGLTKDSDDVKNIYSWRGLNLLGFVLMEVRDFLRDFGFFDPLAENIIPPWQKFPEPQPYEMFWRMGKGEDYIHQFSIEYDKLSERDKIIYKLCNPTPYEWKKFYGQIK